MKKPWSRPRSRPECLRSAPCSSAGTSFQGYSLHHGQALNRETSGLSSSPARRQNPFWPVSLTMNHVALFDTLAYILCIPFWVLATLWAVKQFIGDHIHASKQPHSPEREHTQRGEA
jgi:hypothetical protein